MAPTFHNKKIFVNELSINFIALVSALSTNTNTHTHTGEKSI